MDIKVRQFFVGAYFSSLFTLKSKRRWLIHVREGRTVVSIFKLGVSICERLLICKKCFVPIIHIFSMQTNNNL